MKIYRLDLDLWEQKISPNKWIYSINNTQFISQSRIKLNKKYMIYRSPIMNPHVALIHFGWFVKNKIYNFRTDWNKIVWN